MKNKNTTYLEINGIRYAGWESIRIERSMETLSGAFSLEVTDRWMDNSKLPLIKPDDLCRVRIDEDVLITGYVDEVNPSLDANSHTIEITGRDFSGDLVDCSVAKNVRQNGKLEQIVAELVAPYAGIKVIPQVDTGEAFSKFLVEQGDSVFEAIQRLCKLRAILALSDGKGNIILTTAGQNQSNTALVQGKNIKSIKRTNSHKERFSEILVKGQSPDSDHVSAKVFTQAKGMAFDSSIKRFRPLVVVAEGKVNNQQCQERAAWEVVNRVGKGDKSTIQVQGWRQGNGQLWDINSLVSVQASGVNLTDSMLISSVVFTLDAQNGSITELTVVSPKAFQLIRALPIDYTYAEDL